MCVLWDSSCSETRLLWPVPSPPRSDGSASQDTGGHFREVSVCPVHTPTHGGPSRLGLVLPPSLSRRGPRRRASKHLPKVTQRRRNRGRQPLGLG